MLYAATTLVAVSTTTSATPPPSQVGNVVAPRSFSQLPKGAKRTISYDERSFILDGERTLMMGGAVHYNRVLPADWEGVFDKMVELGLNSVQTLSLIHI